MKRRIQFWVIILLAALLLGQPAGAESPYSVDIWTTADGLPEGSVIAITQTRDGYLWLGTLNGLARFDGNSFTPFNVDNTPGLPSNRIVFLFEDSRSNLWVGTENAGLCVIRNGAVTQFPATTAGGRVGCAFEDAAGTVWFSTATGGVFRWQNGQLDTRPANVSNELALQLFNRSKHLLVPGKNGGDWKLQDGHITRTKGEAAGAGLIPWATALVPSRFQSPMGYVGLVQIDANVAAAIVDADGNLVVGTAGAGVYWATSAGDWRHITASGNPFQDSVLSLCFDRDGNLWVGTDGGGIYRVKKSYFAAPDGLPEDVAKSVSEDAAGGVWVAFNAHGLAYSRSNSVSSYPIGRGTNAWSVLVDRRQQVWAGTRGEGLFRFDAGAFWPVAAADKAGMQIFSLLEDRAGTLWAGGDAGLAGYDGQNWKFFGAANGLPAYSVRALAEDTNGALWIGTESGLFVMQNGQIAAANAPVRDVTSLLTGDDGILWVGSSGHGLAWLSDGRWTRCASTNGLAGDDIGYLIDDGRKNLWIGSYEGLMRVEKSALTAFAADPEKKIPCRTFLTSECSAGAQPAAVRTRDGRLLFPTITGVVAVDPARLVPNTNPPAVVIESVLVDGQSQSDNPLNSTWEGHITLTPQNEQLEVHFTALNFSAPKGAQFGARFKYRLEGRDKKSIDVGSERVARFGRLAPGDYLFRVTACNEDGYWNETGATIAITIEPPFWRKPWFIATAVVIFLGALAGTIYLISTAKLKRQLREAQQKEIIEVERARIARDLHDQLGANLTQITLLGEMAESDKELPAEVEEHAQQICATARDTTRSLDEIVWAVNPSNDTLESLVNYACKYAQDYFAMAGLRFRSELPPAVPPTPILPEVRHNVFLAFKEAVNNVVKHAHATEAHVKLDLEPHQFILSVRDNGRGLAGQPEKKLRNGLKNMRRRLADIHGQFDIGPAPQAGTVVTLTVPIPNGR